MIQISKFSGNNERFRKLLSREYRESKEVLEIVTEIIEKVEAEGDNALFSYMNKFDNIKLTSNTIRVTKEEINKCEKMVNNDYKVAAQKAIKNIQKYHEKQRISDYTVNYEHNVNIKRRYLPLSSICVTVPASIAPLSSSVFMNIIPAQIAGVKNITMIAAPQNGAINPYILYNAKLLGVTNILKISGAQGIAAVSLGTESIERVDKVVGPGNVYVQTAKKLLYGRVGIDSLAGPSEIIILIDDDTNPDFIAADLLAQAEHGTGMEASVAFCTNEELANNIQSSVVKLISEYKNSSVQESIKEYGNIFIVDKIEDAVDPINLLAPEHLQIITKNSEDIINKIFNVGTIFVGNYSPEAVGDYFCGSNHVLPTMRTARFSSGLSVYDFIKGSSMVSYTKEALDSNASHISVLAENEQMLFHKLSVEIRRKNIY